MITSAELHRAADEEGLRSPLDIARIVASEFAGQRMGIQGRDLSEALLL
ncbi:MAG: hypothetical protein ACE5JO_02120 [Candidatus Binatia bacterium]